MKPRVIFETPWRVDSVDFLHLGAPLANIDEIVATEPALRFTLDYPFEKPYAGVISTAAGASLRQILDAIRAGFRAMYAATSPEGGPYGRAHQAFDHLFIDRIELVDDVLEIVVTT